MSSLIKQVISKQDLSQADIDDLAKRHFGRHQYARYGLSIRPSSNTVSTSYVITDEAAQILYPVNVAENCTIRGNLFTYTNTQKTQEILQAIAAGQWHHRELRTLLIRIHNRVMPLIPVFENNPSQMRFSMEDKVKLIANLVSMARNHLLYKAHTEEPSEVHLQYDIGTSFRAQKAVQLMVALAGGHVSIPIPYAAKDIRDWQSTSVCLSRYIYINEMPDNSPDERLYLVVQEARLNGAKIEGSHIAVPINPHGIDSLPEILKGWVLEILTPQYFKTFLSEGIQSPDTPLSIINASAIGRIYSRACDIYKQLWASLPDFPDTFEAFTGEHLTAHLDAVEKINAIRTHRRRASDQTAKQRNAKRRAKPNRLKVDPQFEEAAE